MRRALGSFLEQSYGAAFGVLLGVGARFCRRYSTGCLQDEPLPVINLSKWPYRWVTRVRGYNPIYRGLNKVLVEAIFRQCPGGSEYPIHHDGTATEK